MNIKDVYYQYLSLERELENSIVRYKELIKNQNGSLSEGLKDSMDGEIQYRRNKLEEYGNKTVKIINSDYSEYQQKCDIENAEFSIIHGF